MEIFKHAVMITGFVFVMMLIIEYINVQTRGIWQKRLSMNRFGQYLLAALLGATPGCLGAFAVVAMYSHRALTLGAVVAAMVATAGDESFVMFAMVPRQALIIHGLLLGLGIIAGVLTDLIVGKRMTAEPCIDGFSIHDEVKCDCFPGRLILSQWKSCIASRGILAVMLVPFIIALIVGEIGPEQWNWMKITMLLVTLLALFIVGTVPDHFLEDHLWRHVARRHLLPVFLWTFGALIAIHFLEDYLQLQHIMKQGKWIVLLVACLVGIIPESGPHLIFVVMFANGSIPGSILLASSIVQDGHGMLPMLAHSRRDFITIKAVSFTLGMLCGAIGLALDM